MSNARAASNCPKQSNYHTVKTMPTCNTKIALFDLLFRLIAEIKLILYFDMCKYFAKILDKKTLLRICLVGMCRAENILKFLNICMCVYLCGTQRVVTQQLLNLPQVSTLIQQMCGKGVA